ncbi:uncharacterized protein TNCV_1833621 [Trichonephila clavipes]|nr:uncharacterized protein TNCV_1833621 [Trichonephila clavipes]
MEKKHHPARAFCDDINNLRKQVAFVKRKAVAHQASRKKQWRRIIGRMECGHNQLEVSEELGIAQSVISRLWQRFQDDGNVSRCYSTGRPRVKTPNEDRYLAVTAKRNRRSTASDLYRQLPVQQFQGRPCTDA